MLTKIVVRNVGVLKAFDTPNAAALQKLTTIYGKNGRGKTTLSSVLRSASLGKHGILNGRRTFGADASTVNVALKLSDGKTVYYKDGKWSQPTAPLEVFDASFIADNLFAGESVGLNQDRGLFSIILGRDGVKFARQQEYFVATAKRTGARLKECENALSNDLPTDLSRDEFFASPVPENIDDLILEAQKALKAVQQSDRLIKLRRLSVLPIPAIEIDLMQVLEKTLQDIEATARTKLAEHFSRFKLGRQGEEWVKFGLEHIHDESCPFCGKDEVDQQGLITLYNQIFGQNYQAHLDLIRGVIADIERLLGPDALAEMSAVRAANTESVLGWSDFMSFDEALPALDDALVNAASAYAVFKRLLDAKREAPLTAIFEAQAVADARAQLDNSIASIRAYNEGVAKMEVSIANRQGETPLNEGRRWRGLPTS